MWKILFGTKQNLNTNYHMLIILGVTVEKSESLGPTWTQQVGSHDGQHMGGKLGRHGEWDLGRIIILAASPQPRALVQPNVWLECTAWMRYELLLSCISLQECVKRTVDQRKKAVRTTESLYLNIHKKKETKRFNSRRKLIESIFNTSFLIRSIRQVGDRHFHA